MKPKHCKIDIYVCNRNAGHNACKPNCGECEFQVSVKGLFEVGTRPYRVFLKTEGYTGTCILRPTELARDSVINYSALRRAKTAIPVYIP
jgi:hypothetical protein